MSNPTQRGGAAPLPRVQLRARGAALTCRRHAPRLCTRPQPVPMRCALAPNKASERHDAASRPPPPPRAAPQAAAGEADAWRAPQAALQQLLTKRTATPAEANALAHAARAAGAPPASRVEALTWASAKGCHVPVSAVAAPEQWAFLDELVAEGSVNEALTAASLLPRRGACHNRLVWSYCEAGRLEDALAVLNSMRKRGPAPSLATYRVLLIAAGRGRTRRPELVAMLLAQMQARGLALDARTANVLLHTLAVTPAAALRTYAALRAAGCALDVVAYNTLLKMAAAPQSGLPRDARGSLARRVLQDMAKAACAPDEVTLATAVSALGGAGRVEEAFSVWTEMRAGGVAPDARGWAALLSACRSAGQYDRCVALFRGMCAAPGLAPSHHHWNIVIDAAVRAGLPSAAFALAEEMAASNTPPDAVTRNCLLRATAAAHGVEAAFAAATSGPEPPDAVAWTVLVDLCADAGDVRRAAATLAAMRDAGTQPDVVTYTAVIKAHALTGDADGAMRVYREMRDARVRPNEATFLMLLRACRAAHDVQRGTTVYEEMRRAGLRPQNGAFRDLLTSWVDAAIGGAGGVPVNQLPGWLLCSGPGLQADESGNMQPKIDLHGLSAAEARAAVLCWLRQMRDASATLPADGLLLITGRGNNSDGGRAVLREEAQRLCAELRLSCEEDAANPGRLRIPADALRAWLGRTRARAAASAGCA